MLYERWPGYGYEGKFLEQYLTTKLIPHPRGGVLLDVAARSSPYWILCREQFGMDTYRQDLCYKDADDHTFGGYASSIPLPDDSVDTITFIVRLSILRGMETARPLQNLRDC